MRTVTEINADIKLLNRELKEVLATLKVETAFNKLETLGYQFGGTDWVHSKKATIEATHFVRDIKTGTYYYVDKEDAESEGLIAEYPDGSPAFGCQLLPMAYGGYKMSDSFNCSFSTLTLEFVTQDSVESHFNGGCMGIFKGDI